MNSVTKLVGQWILTALLVFLSLQSCSRKHFHSVPSETNTEAKLSEVLAYTSRWLRENGRYVTFSLPWPSDLWCYGIPAGHHGLRRSLGGWTRWKLKVQNTIYHNVRFQLYLAISIGCFLSLLFSSFHSSLCSHHHQVIPLSVLISLQWLSSCSPTCCLAFSVLLSFIIILPLVVFLLFPPPFLLIMQWYSFHSSLWSHHHQVISLSVLIGLP